MSALTLAGKPINWSAPPQYATKVKWSRTTTGGRAVYGSLRSIAWLDHIDSLARKKFGKSVDVIQSAYNTGVAASAGTHDLDACYDVQIVGVPWLTQQAFFRANGAGAYARVEGWSTPHIHLFVLPPVFASGSVSERYDKAGLEVGKFVDGGLSSEGRTVGSSQIADYYMHRDATSNHYIDNSWFPPNIDATVFDFHIYSRRMAPPKTATISLVNIAAKIGKANVRTSFTTALGKGRITCVNESFHSEQRAIYAEEAKRAGYSQYGLRITPNPVFWEHVLYRRTFAKVHLIHGRNTTAKNADEWPGFYDKRELTEVVLAPRAGGQEIAILHTHLLYPARPLDKRWVKKMRRKSLTLIRTLARKHIAAGRTVLVTGDTNMTENFSLPKTMHWLTKPVAIDKIGSNRRGGSKEFWVPNDHHKSGVRAIIRL